MRKQKLLLPLIIIFISVFCLGKVIGESKDKNPHKVKSVVFLREAMFYEKLKDKKVHCRLCFRECIIADERRGICKNKENREGVLYNVVWGKPSAVNVDPIEKEPQLHNLPGTKILCIGTAGCNFRCKHCHNWHLSQQSLEEVGSTYDLSPEEIVNMVLSYNIPTLSFTYNDPISFYEYVYDIAKIAKQKRLKVIWHSNGAINPVPLKDLLKYTDAVTIDLKGFSEEFYRNISSAKLLPVLESMKIIKEKGVWLEIVNLVIPTLNDDMGEIEAMCKWIKENLGENTPLHFSRFFPNYKLTHIQATPVKTLERAYQIARRSGLNYVTIGNVPGHKYNSTFCSKCEKRLIHRVHFTVLDNNIVNGKCKFCQNEIPGIWK